jgi:hypothetical protein
VDKGRLDKAVAAILETRHHRYDEDTTEAE